MGRELEILEEILWLHPRLLISETKMVYFLLKVIQVKVSKDCELLSG